MYYALAIVAEVLYDQFYERLAPFLGKLSTFQTPVEFGAIIQVGQINPLLHSPALVPRLKLTSKTGKQPLM